MEVPEILRGELAARLHRIRRTVLEMLQDRGYTVTDADVEMSFEDFLERYGNNFVRSDLDLNRPRRDEPTNSICVFFVEGHLYKAKLEKYLNVMYIANVNRSVFVVEQSPSTLVRNAISLISRKHLEVFMESELVFNISRHVLVPKHEVLARDEKQKLLDKYNLKLVQLPRIHMTDPPAKYLGLKCGDVLKITRRSEAAGRYVTYRVAV